MKKILYVSIAVALIFSACKKQPVDQLTPVVIPPAYLSVVQKYVRQHVSYVDYNNIDFDRYHVSKQKAHWYLRIPLKNKTLATDFILLQTDSLGNTTDGKFILLEKTANAKTVTDPSNYNGVIDIASLDRKMVMRSAITKGYIESWHADLFAKAANAGLATAKAESFPVPYDELPEVVVVAYIPSATAGTGLSWSDYMMLENMFGAGGGGSSADGGTAGGDTNYTNEYGYGVYSPIDNNSSGSNTGSPQPVDQDIKITFDESVYRPAIDLAAWLKCFTDIPDAGSTCSVSICADLPVDDDPNQVVNLFTGATGHCFLQLSKSNNGQSVTQIIGFTAQNAWSAMQHPDQCVPGKLVDNAGHKYNASITIQVNASAFYTMLGRMEALNGAPYSIILNDCLDYDLNVVNTIRGGDPLQLPTNYASTSAFDVISTGERFYQYLESKKEAGDADSPGIVIGGPFHAGQSHGPCN